MTSLVFCVSGRLGAVAAVGVAVGVSASACCWVTAPAVNTSSPFLNRWSTEVSISFLPGHSHRLEMGIC